MGLEATCRVQHGEHTGSGRAQLETDTLRFKGEDFRLSIPLRDIQKLSVRSGRLEVGFGTKTAVFHLGDQAMRWAEKIRNPPSVLDKLGVKTDMAIALAGTPDTALVEQIRARTPHVGKPRAGTELAFLFAGAVRDLGRLESLKKAIAPAGAIWVVWPKGRPELREDHVRAEARDIGLVDVKVASVSAALSGLKLMIPRAKR
jgi:hypothetical protein